MKKQQSTFQAGFINPLLIPTIILGVLVLVFGGLAIWAFSNYTDQKTNVDAKVSAAVTQAKSDVTSQDAKAFVEKEKLPNLKFSGPAELGSVTFMYPKTWSVYIDRDNPAQGGDQFEAYLQPGVVSPLSGNTPYALRVSISTRQYSSVLNDFSSQVKKGTLTSSPVTLSGQTGTRFDGAFSDTITGAMIVMQIRNQTLQIYTQSPPFLTDFNTTILPTLKFNP